MKEWKKPEVLDLRIALTAGAAKNKRPNHSSHVLPTPIPQITPIDDESDIML
ncbi:MAG: hypothetical protein IJF03_11415 [Lachnospiraceae bacterium]|nr:hypothetical protein [Lachnospiraceae bacterium]